jgi:5-methylcytosine-specific restriction endonuclease McrA
MRLTNEQIEEIYDLDNRGYSVNAIAKHIGCHRTTVTMYRLGNVTDKAKARRKRVNEQNKEYRKSRPWFYRLAGKVSAFKSIRTRRSGTNGNGKYEPVAIPEQEYRTADVLLKLAENPTCYLTGRKLNIKNPSSYSLDHIKPRSRGGSIELSNMGFTCPEANESKSSRTVKEHLDYCAEVLTNHGYSVEEDNHGE